MNNVVIGFDNHDDCLAEGLICLCDECQGHYEGLIHDTQMLGIMPGLAKLIIARQRNYWGGEAL